MAARWYALLQRTEKLMRYTVIADEGTKVTILRKPWFGPSEVAVLHRRDHENWYHDGIDIDTTLGVGTRRRLERARIRFLANLIFTPTAALPTAKLLP